MADRVGQQLGNYRLVRLLGRGGTALVYLGEHTRLGTQAAIKVLHTQLASDEESVFQQEARTIAALEHAQIIRVLDFDVQEGTPFLVMQYAPNGTLRTRHPRGSQLDLATILPYVKQVAEALQYAHDEKLIHRDIKPENMLLGKRGEVLLSDFGIATVAQSSRYQGTQEVAGTVAYMAPEQVQGKPRPASDQYALGITVYEWLMGERPFHGSFTEIATQHVLMPPPSLRENLPTISPAVEQVVLIALAKDAKERFGSVQAFATALEQAALLDQPTQFIRPSAPLTQPPTIVVPASRLPAPPPFAPTLRTPQPELGVSPAQASPITYRGHTGTVYSVAWSPDGAYIASASEDGSVRVWDVSTGKKHYTYHGHTSTINSLAWSPNGAYIASGSNDKTVHIWDAHSGATLITYDGHSKSGYAAGWSPFIYAVAWSPDGSQIVSGDYVGIIQVWRVSDGRKILTYSGHHHPKQGLCTVYAVAWSPNGNQIISAAQDSTIQKWNAATGERGLIYQSREGVVRAVGWSPTSDSIVSAGAAGLQVWEAVTGKTLSKVKGHDGPIYAVAWSPAGQHIASGGEDGIVQIWDAVTGNALFTYRGHSAGIRAVAWSPSGTHIASAGKDKTVQVWRVP